MPDIRGLGNVAPVARDAAEQIASKFGVYNIGGFATAGHIPGSDHYTGHAIDVMVYKDKAKGDMIAQWVMSNWDALGVKYVIWYRTYYPAPGKTQPYAGTSPHTDHVHISFKNVKGGGATTDPGSTEDLSGREGCLDIFKQLLGL